MKNRGRLIQDDVQARRLTEAIGKLADGEVAGLDVHAAYRSFEDRLSASRGASITKPSSVVRRWSRRSRGLAVVLALVTSGGVAVGIAAGAGVFSNPPISGTVNPKTGDFVTLLSFANGALTVSPPPSATQPTVSKAVAQDLFLSTEGVGGGEENAFGLGTAVFDQELRASLGPSKLASPGGATAWVGIVYNSLAYCPEYHYSGPSTAVTIVVIDAQNPQDVVQYQSGGLCGIQRAPKASPAEQLLSVPWTLVSQSGSQASIQYTATSCSSLSATTLPMMGGGPSSPLLPVSESPSTLAVIVKQPFATARCQPETFPLEVEGLGTEPIGHDAVGPVDVITNTVIP